VETPVFNAPVELGLADRIEKLACART